MGGGWMVIQAHPDRTFLTVSLKNLKIKQDCKVVNRYTHIEKKAGIFLSHPGDLHFFYR